MIALDTNLLVYAHRRDSEFFENANAVLKTLAEGDDTWTIPWPCINEFIAIVTHPRIYSPASTLREAIDQVDLWFESPSIVVIGESDMHWEMLKATAESGRVVGPMIHDARIVAICLSHGVNTLYSADRDFGRFRDLKVHNPLLQ